MKNLKWTVIAALSLALASAATAQLETRTRGDGPMQPGQPRQMPPPAVVLGEGQYLFVFEGLHGFKVSKSDLSIVAQCDLAPPERMAAAADMAPARPMPIKRGLVVNNELLKSKGGPDKNGPPPPDQGRGMDGPPGPRMGGMPIVLVADDNYLYVIGGIHIWKLSKHDLTVVTQTDLRGPAQAAATETAPLRGR